MCKFADLSWCIITLHYSWDYERYLEGGREAKLHDIAVMKLHYEGKYIAAFEVFRQHYKNLAAACMKYHFGARTTLFAPAIEHFNNLKRQYIPAAEILYEKGFDLTDLLMLSDEVEDELVAMALRRCTDFHRGFWALDILRAI